MSERLKPPDNMGQDRNLVESVLLNVWMPPNPLPISGQPAKTKVIKFYLDKGA